MTAYNFFLCQYFYMAGTAVSDVFRTLGVWLECCQSLKTLSLFWFILWQKEKNIFNTIWKCANVILWQCQWQCQCQGVCVTVLWCDTFIDRQCDNVTISYFDSVTVLQFDSVTVWQCDRVTVWQCDSVTLWKCGNVTVWQGDSVTMWQCDSECFCGQMFPDLST